MKISTHNISIIPQTTAASLLYHVITRAASCGVLDPVRINIRKCESDDDFASDYHSFQMDFDGWNDRLETWLSKVSPRFRHHFNEVYAKAERFSGQYDNQYTYVGDVPELLKLYDDFYKKKVAVDELATKIGLDGWRLKENDDVIFELIQVEERLNRFLCIKHLSGTYKVHQFRDSYFEKTLVEALDKNNKSDNRMLMICGLMAVLLRTFITKMTLVINKN